MSKSLEIAIENLQLSENTGCSNLEAMAGLTFGNHAAEKAIIEGMI